MSTGRVLLDRTSPSVPRRGLVLVPVGSVEQHGPHLPLDTDTVIATAVAARLAEALDGVVAPAVAYGASGEHQSYPGTISIGTDVLTSTLLELGRSVTTWASRILFVNGHGGNLAAVHRAVDRLRCERRDVAWVPCATRDADAHAGRTETSLMLRLDPDRVRTDRLEPGNVTPIARLLPFIRMSGVAAVSVNGILGDPTGASAAEGDRILDEMVATALERLGTVAVP